MRIYGIKPEENEMADRMPAGYVKLAQEYITKSNEWMKDSDKPYQSMLVNIEILLMLADRYPSTVNGLIKKAQIKEWQETFNEWFERCGKKIPTKHREGIRKSADDLFEKLGKYGNNIKWL